MQVEHVHGFRVARLAETTSTNTVVAAEARRGAPEGLVVVADFQSAGRGRFERSWEAPRGTALLFSVLFVPARAGLSRERWHLAVAALSLALAKAAQRLSGAQLVLKWPNDLLGVDGRKVAGVLAEVSGEALVVGAGVNVHWAPEGAASLDELAGAPVDRDALLEGVLRELRGLYGSWQEVATLYRELLATTGQEVVVSLAGAVPGTCDDGPRPGRQGAAPKGATGQLRGRAVGVTEEGALVLENQDGSLVQVAAGDVEHLRPIGAQWAKGPMGEGLKG